MSDAKPASGEILTRDAFESLVGDWTLGGPGGIRTVEMVLPIQNRLKQHDAALRAEVGRLKDALDRQAAHYGGALSIEKARADAAERERDEARAEIVNERRQHQDARSEFSRIYDLCSTVQEQRDAAEARIAALTEALRGLAECGCARCSCADIAAAALKRETPSQPSAGATLSPSKKEA